MYISLANELIKTKINLAQVTMARRAHQMKYLRFYF
jgi:hypothetical protein